MSTESWEADDFRKHVQRAVDQFKRGDLFMRCGLNESDPIIDEDGSIPSPKDKKHHFNILMNYITDEIIKEKGLEKSARKPTLKRLRSFGSEWVALIVASASPKKKKKKKKPTKKESPAENSDGNATEAEAGVSLNDGQEQVASTPNRTPQEEQLLQEARDRFEKEKKDTLAHVPDGVKARFGQMYFTRWSGKMLPCLVLSPYETGQTVRDLWLSMFEKCKAGNRLDHMTNIVYWYGAYKDPANAYSLLATSKLVPYDDGCKKGYNKVPKALEQKMAKGKRITAQHALIFNGLQELEDDLKKDPVDRRGFMPPFEEEFEIVEYPFEQEPLEEEVKLKGKAKKRKSIQSTVEEEVKPKKKKAKKSSEPKKKVVEEEVEAEAVEEQEETEVNKSSKTNTKKQIKKRSGIKDTVEATAELNKGTPVPPLKRKKKKKKSKTDAFEEANKPDQEALEPSLETVGQPTLAPGDNFDNIGDDDISSHEDKDDVDVEPPSESDDDDEDYNEAPKKRKKSQSKKEPPKKKTSKAKSKIEKEPKDKKRAPNQEALRRRAQRKFEQNEHNFLPLVHRWEEVIKKKDCGDLEKIYEELIGNIEAFTPAFVETYNLPTLIKQSKTVLDNATRKKAWSLLKDTYFRKKDEIPPGFKPRKRPVVSPKMTDVKKEEPPQEKTTATEESQDAKTKDGSSSVPPSPIKRIGSLEKVNVPVSTANSVKIERSAVVKTVKKPKFSLGTLMGTKPAVTSKPIVKSEGGRAISSPARRTKMPTWVSEPTTGILDDDNRCFALEFLQQAAPFVPTSTHVNHDAVARALEVATFRWAGGERSDPKWFDKYWEKIHELVACISGDRKAGTIATMIGEGKFQSADEILQLSEDALLLSFHGKAIIL